jgi:hypothetical protein
MSRHKPGIWPALRQVASIAVSLLVFLAIVSFVSTCGAAIVSAATCGPPFAQSVISHTGVMTPNNALCFDGQVAEIGVLNNKLDPNAQLVLDMDTGNEIVDEEGPDFYFHERTFDNDRQVALDPIEIALAPGLDGVVPSDSEYLVVFRWGDRDPTNNSGVPQEVIPIDGSEPIVNITSTLLYEKTGFAIDIKGEQGRKYRFVRIRYPAQSQLTQPNQVSEVDAIRRISPESRPTPSTAPLTPSAEPTIATTTVIATPTTATTTSPTDEPTATPPTDEPTTTPPTDEPTPTPTRSGLEQPVATPTAPARPTPAPAPQDTATPVPPTPVPPTPVPPTPVPPTPAPPTPVPPTPVPPTFTPTSVPPTSMPPTFTPTPVPPTPVPPTFTPTSVPPTSMPPTFTPTPVPPTSVPVEPTNLPPVLGPPAPTNTPNTQPATATPSDTPTDAPIEPSPPAQTTQGTAATSSAAMPTNATAATTSTAIVSGTAVNQDSGEVEEIPDTALCQYYSLPLIIFTKFVMGGDCLTFVRGSLTSELSSGVIASLVGGVFSFTFALHYWVNIFAKSRWRPKGHSKGRGWGSRIVVMIATWICFWYTAIIVAVSSGTERKYPQNFLPFPYTISISTFILAIMYAVAMWFVYFSIIWLNKADKSEIGLLRYFLSNQGLKALPYEICMCRGKDSITYRYFDDLKKPISVFAKKIHTSIDEVAIIRDIREEVHYDPTPKLRFLKKELYTTYNKLFRRGRKSPPPPTGGTTPPTGGTTPPTGGTQGGTPPTGTPGKPQGTPPVGTPGAAHSTSSNQSSGASSTSSTSTTGATPLGQPSQPAKNSAKQSRRKKRKP